MIRRPGRTSARHRPRHRGIASFQNTSTRSKRRSTRSSPRCGSWSAAGNTGDLRNALNAITRRQLAGTAERAREFAEPALACRGGLPEREGRGPVRRRRLRRGFCGRERHLELPEQLPAHADQLHHRGIASEQRARHDVVRPRDRAVGRHVRAVEPQHAVDAGSALALRSVADRLAALFTSSRTSIRRLDDDAEASQATSYLWRLTTPWSDVATARADIGDPARVSIDRQRAETCGEIPFNLHRRRFIVDNATRVTTASSHLDNAVLPARPRASSLRCQPVGEFVVAEHEQRVIVRRTASLVLHGRS